MDDDIAIIERKEVDMKDAVLIEGFPSVGMVSTIVSNYLIKMLNLEYVGLVSSRHFYPTAIISDSVPLPPLRIYSGKPICLEKSICSKVVVLTSEFPPPTELIKP
ncbi:MAG: PAC2 family protein, partial [Thermoplasmata archaeon]|nr:PAC2 family protein [Thermoplasmata archaeon]